jgi:hypothetical protein
MTTGQTGTTGAESNTGSVSIEMPLLSMEEAAKLAAGQADYAETIADPPPADVIKVLQYEWHLSGAGADMSGIAGADFTLNDLGTGRWRINAIALYNSYPIGAGSTEFVVVSGEHITVQLTITTEPDDIPPGEVKNPSVRNGDTTVELFWENPTDYDLYHIEVSYAQTLWRREVVERNKASVLITGLLSDEPEDITFTIRTVDIWKNRSEGVQISAHPSAPPNIVSDLAVESALSHEIILKWTDPTNSDFIYGDPPGHIEITFYPGILGMAQPVCIEPGVERAVFAKTVNGISYLFMVKSVDRWGVKSLPVRIHAISEPPKNVKNLKASTGNTRVTLEWVDPSYNVDNLEVTFQPEVPDITQPIEVPKADPPGGINTCNIIGLENSVDYTFTVKTISHGDSSSGVSITAMPVPPPPVELSGTIELSLDIKDNNLFSLDTGAGQRSKAYDGSDALIIQSFTISPTGPSTFKWSGTFDAADEGKQIDFLIAVLRGGKPYLASGGQITLVNNATITVNYINIADAASLAKIAVAANPLFPSNGVYRISTGFGLSAYPSWTPIGEFNGFFDGTGKAITGLNINSASGQNTGLFASTGSNSEIKNINLVDCNINIGNYDRVGGIVGYNKGLITGSAVTTYVIKTEGKEAGGIAGRNEGSIIGCFNSSVAISGTDMAGGIAGINAGTIKACFTNAIVGKSAASGSSTFGYISGNNSGTISGAYWTQRTDPGDDATGGVGSGSNAGTKEFGEDAGSTGWPTVNESGWELDYSPYDGFDANTGDPRYWRNLGSWNTGTPTYPRLWWG